MAAMQALGPEMKKLQQKYKGPENRALLNEEMMKLYKEHNVNPASGCLPMLLQMPFFFMLYSVIRGITNTVSKGAALPYTYVTDFTANAPASVPRKCVPTRGTSPRQSKMYHDIVAAHGQLISGGMDFAAKLLSHHASPWAYIPYAVLVAGAVGLQYLQMARLNARNPQANQANPQAAMLQKYMPLIFGFIYLNVAAILNVYFIVSSAIRIGTQEVLFRQGHRGRARTRQPRRAAASPRSIAAAKDNGIESTEKALPKPKGGGKSGTGPRHQATRRAATARPRRPTGARHSSDSGSGRTGSGQEAAPPVEGQKREKGALTRGVGGS